MHRNLVVFLKILVKIMAIENLKKHNDFNTFNFYCGILAICKKNYLKKEEQRRLDHSSFELPWLNI
jgi:hypothetical protein